jgi:hypothetical protein
MIFPNPAKEELTIRTPSNFDENAQISITENTGTIPAETLRYK